ncbi:dephospho-CoA kinase [Kineococcus arenarius]|uniref:dephospho-CoA kinase n=1 Tax=Kineococcus sp. SYSU DK007 TaxID=3383128 RepID=UPI003D7C4011
MLRVGLTGGIGAGKSTVARLLARCGAVLVDADVLAREVVSPGTPGLRAVAERFGPRVLTATGELDRAALGRLVFSDPAARADLNALVHPLVAARREELVAAAPAQAVVVEDVPLLVETGAAARFPLVVVVHADVEERVRRLVEDRGMSRDDARARVAAQAGDDERLAAADVVLDNARRPEGAPDPLPARVEELWSSRLVPFERHLRERRPAPLPASVVVAPDPSWPAQAARLAARVARAAGVPQRDVEHVGPTAVRGAPAVDVLDLQLAVDSPPDVEAVADPLTESGFPAVPGARVRPDAPAEALHASADPGRPARLLVRVRGSESWRRELLLRDWARAVAPSARSAVGGPGSLAAAREWAVRTGWSAPG